MNKRIIIPAVIVITLSVGLIVAVLFFQTNNTRDRASVDTEMNNTITPASCTEKTRSYNQGDGFDSTATWDLTYACADNLEAVYADVKTTAEKNDYIIEGDDVYKNKSNNSYSANLCLSRNGYLSEWRFNSNNNGFDAAGKPLEPTVSLNIRTTSYSPCTS